MDKFVQKTKHVIFVLIHFLYFEVKLLFKENIPEDAACSGLSSYIYKIADKRQLVIKTKGKGRGKNL